MMWNRYLAAGAVCALIVASVRPAAAADQILQVGKSTALPGEITGFTRTDVTIKGRTRETKVPVNEIARVRWDGEPPKLNTARTHEENGRLDLALPIYLEAEQEAGAQNANLRKDVQFLIARTTARMAEADPQKLDEAIEKLEGFISANANHFRYYDALLHLGRAQLVKGNFTEASKLFDDLEQAPWNDYKMAARIARGRLQLKQDQFAAALQTFDQVASMPAEQPGELARRYEALLGKATCLQRQQQFDQAVEVLDGVIDQVPPNETAIQAEAYVRQGDILQAQNKLKAATLAYLHVDVLFAREKALHAEALYHLARLGNSIDDLRLASEARGKLESDYPNSDWAKKLASGG